MCFFPRQKEIHPGFFLNSFGIKFTSTTVETVSKSPLNAYDICVYIYVCNGWFGPTTTHRILSKFFTGVIQPQEVFIIGDEDFFLDGGR